MKKIFRTLLIYFSVFLIFFTLFFYIQFSFLNLAGADAYYHIKQAWLIRTQGIEKAVQNFSWLQCSIYREHPGDLWFGYHLLLYPFTFGDLVFGAKLSSVVFASLLFLGFFWLLERLKIKHSFLWTISLLIMTSSFTYRLFLPRPYIFSILFSIIGFYLISQKKYLETFLLSFIYSFITAEAPLIVFIALVFTIFERLKTKKLDFKPLVLTISGILTGLIVQPDFPHNLYLIFHQLFSTLSLRFIGVNLSFGGEISCGFIGSVKENIFLFLAFALPLIWLVFQFASKKRRQLSLLQSSLFFFSFFFAFFSFFLGSRFVEYWVPFTVLLAAFWFNFYFLPAISKVINNIKELKEYQLTFIYEKLSHFYRKVYDILRSIILQLEKKFVRYIISGTFCFLFIYFVFYQSVTSSFLLRGTDPIILKAFEEGALWLQNNTPSASVVLNFQWDTFPFLFFFNHQNYYCSGMDPTFMYVENPKNYLVWQNMMNRGLFCDEMKCDEEHQKLTQEDSSEVSAFLKEELGGQYLFLNFFQSLQNQDLTDFLESAEKFEKVFKKGKIEIYKIN